MSQHSMAPRSGHVDELQRVFGYLQKHPDGKIAIDIADHPFGRTSSMRLDNNGLNSALMLKKTSLPTC
jgi:hypothetical protein